MLVAVLIGLTHSLRGTGLVPLLLAAAAVLFSFGRLLSTRAIWQRLLWGGASWSGLLLLGLQPEVKRLSDIPWSPWFWQSHFWMGWILTGLLLSSAVMQPLIGGSKRLRHLHVATNVVVALLLAMQAISGSRDLMISGLLLHGAS